jgi:hypothetical protein
LTEKILQKSLNTSARTTTAYVIIYVITADEKHQGMNMSEKCVVQGVPMRQPKGQQLTESGNASSSTRCHRAVPPTLRGMNPMSLVKMAKRRHRYEGLWNRIHFSRNGGGQNEHGG